MKVDKKELRRIVDNAEKRRNTAKRSGAVAQRKRTITARSAAMENTKRIINAIPEALKKSAARAKSKSHAKSSKYTITAHIPIAKERLWGVMSISGSLSDKDALILQMVRGRLKKLRIKGVTLRVRYRVRECVFVSADGLDRNPGPCKFYYLEAQTSV